ncbi:MAG: iron chelate uptake ABC transporter family permease subunit [Coriobacteriales bacterium]|jgi:iron complex transport system permease protein
MASKKSDSDTHASASSYTATDIARLRNGSFISRSRAMRVGTVSRKLSMRETNKLYRAEHDRSAIRVAISIGLLIVISFFSLCCVGAAGQDYSYSGPYWFYTPLQVWDALYLHAYNAIADVTHAFDPRSKEWLLENCPCYWAVFDKLQVVGITLICAALLSISGMLYQNVFKNPIAGPNMLGASSGIQFGVMLLVAIYGSAATDMVNMRYLLCYGIGAAILVLVMVCGKKLSRRGKPFDILSTVLIGMILGQLLGFVVQYMTLFVMDEQDYQTFYTISQMLTVDTSATSWIVLGIVSVLSILPVYLLRFKMNALSFDEQDVKLLGINYNALRIVALICGAIMMLAAQIHTGVVGMVTLLAPFLARSLFGTEFTKQFTGSICCGMIFLLVCRDITDCIPFVGDGIAIGSVVSIVALPLFILIVVRGMRSWE